MLQTENLSFQYKSTNQTFQFPNIHLKEKENLLILGPSGVGKTTFLHLLAGLLKPLSGKIIINNVDITALKSHKLDQFRGKHIGLVFQKKHAISSLNMLDNLKARLHFSKQAIHTAAIDNLLAKLDLRSVKKSKTNTLSEGQLQRLGIALAVIHHPQIILADEPTSSLDDANCIKVITLLLQQAQATNANLIVITHDHRIKSYFQNSIEL